MRILFVFHYSILKIMHRCKIRDAQSSDTHSQLKQLIQLPKWLLLKLVFYFTCTVVSITLSSVFKCLPHVNASDLFVYTIYTFTKFCNFKNYRNYAMCAFCVIIIVCGSIINMKSSSSLVNPPDPNYSSSFLLSFIVCKCDIEI